MLTRRLFSSVSSVRDAEANVVAVSDMVADEALVGKDLHHNADVCGDEPHYVHERVTAQTETKMIQLKKKII